MALSIELSVDISTDREDFVLSDDTVYGGANPARATCLVFVDAFKMNHSSEATELTCTGNNSNPATDTAWTIQYTEDGWYKIYFVIIDEQYSSGTTYAAYDAVHNGSGAVYRSKVAGNLGNALSSTTHWELIAADDVADLANNKDTATESLNIVSTIYHRVLRANGQYEFANQLSDQCTCSDCDTLELLHDYNIFAQWLDGAEVADSRSEVLDGELICRRIQSEYID